MLDLPSIDNPFAVNWHAFRARVMSCVRKGLQMSSNLYQFDQMYWRYDTELTDPRVLKFIEALQKYTSVRFSEQTFKIVRIHLTPVRAEIVLREVDE